MLCKKHIPRQWAHDVKLVYKRRCDAMTLDRRQNDFIFAPYLFSKDLLA